MVDYFSPDFLNGFVVRTESGFGLVFNKNTREIFEIDEITADILSSLPYSSWQEIYTKYSKDYALDISTLKNRVRAVFAKINNHQATSSDIVKNKKNLFKKYPRLNAPLVMDWNFSKRCNLRCEHCCSEADASYSFPDIKTLKSYINQFSELKIFQVGLLGGEPFLYPQLKDLVQAIVDSNITICSITTNGTCLNADILNFLKDKVTDIHVSLDGHTAHLHDKFRRVPGTFQRAVNGIRLIREHGIPVMISHTINKYNYRHLADMLEFCNSLDISSFEAGGIMPTKVALENDHTIFPPELNKQLSDVLASYKEKVNYEIVNINNWEFIYEPRKKSLPKGALVCGAGNESLAIEDDGSVYPCVFAEQPEFLIGNLNNESLGEMLQRRDTPFDHIEKLSPSCRNCKYYGVECSAGCRMLSYMVTGDFYEKDPSCPL